MRKLFSINSNQAPILVTLFTVILLGVVYVFVYIPQNERELKEQRFRSLQRIDENIHQKISNSIFLMDGLLKASFDKNVSRAKIDSYIAKYTRKNFTLFPVQGAPDTALKEQAQKKNITPIFSDAEDGVSAIRVNDARRMFKLFYAKRFPHKNKDSCYYMSMAYNFDDFIQPLLPDNVFDGYIVFSKGNVVYESFPSGLSYTQKDSLLNVHNGVAGSAIRDQSISGIDYKMFLQPVGFDSTNEWIIGGLLSADRYNSEKKALPTGLIVLLMIIALLIVISLPWIKLYQMGSRDRLTLLDGSLSFFVAMLLTSMLFFTALWASTALCKTETATAEKTIAANIETAFKNEIDSAYNEIRSFDSLMFVDPEFKTSLVNLKTDTSGLASMNRFGDGRYQQRKGVYSEKLYSLLNTTVSINHAFWMNYKGDDLYYWTRDSVYPPPGNFNKRGYFKNISENKPLFLDGDISKPFFIEQVVSWTAGTFRTVISIPSKTQDTGYKIPSIAVLSINVKSLDSVIIPEGIQFAITDAKGDVLYHYYPSRNLNENLIDEFSEKQKLSGSYQAHVAETFHTDYYGNRFDVYVKPIKNLPYFLVILSDKEYTDTRDVQVFGTTLSFVFVFFLFQLVEVITIVLIIIFSKNSSFKGWTLAASWLWPKKCARDEYIIATLYNIILIVLQTIFFTICSFAENCFMLLPGISFITICFNALFVKRNRREGKYIYARNKLKIISCIGLFIVALNMLAGYTLDKFWLHFLWFEIIAVALLLLLVFFKDKTISIVKGIFPKALRSRCNYINSYALMAVTRFIISNGMPVVLFYISSFNYQQNLLAHYKQVEFAKNVIQKKPHLDSAQSILAAYTDGIYIKEDSVLASHKDTALLSKEDLIAITLLNAFHYYNNDISGKTQYLNEVQSSDSSYVFGNAFNHGYKGRDTTSTSVKIPQNGKYLKLSSTQLFYNFERFSGAWKIWLLLTGALFIFYLAVHKIIKKMFALDLPAIGMWRKLDDAILTRTELNKYVLIIGPPGSGKLNSLLDKVDKDIVYVTDLINIPVKNANENNDKTGLQYCLDRLLSEEEKKEAKRTWKEMKAKAKEDQYKLVIVDHFGHNMNHPETNYEKLAFIEEVMVAHPNKKIIILSTVHPYVFLDSLSAQQKDEGGNTDYGLQRWTEVLGHYRIIFHPLEKSGFDDKVKKLKKLVKEFEEIPKQSIIDNELPADIMIDNLNTVLYTLEMNKEQEAAIDIHSEAREKKSKELQHIVQNILDDIEGTPADKAKGKINIPVTSYEVLLEKAKQLLRDIIALMRDELTEPGQKMLRETKYTHFLNKLHQPLSETFLNTGNKHINSDNLALKIELTSQHYYMYIWNSLTKEEKFILYDLAEDGLVNTNDTLNLSMLIGKGIIQKDDDGILRLFSKGFRNFIIMSIGYTESKKLKNEISENGNWSRWRTPLVIIIVAIFSLLIISQQEVYTKVIGYLTVLVTAIIPLLQRLFTLFEKNNSKS